MHSQTPAKPKASPVRSRPQLPASAAAAAAAAVEPPLQLQQLHTTPPPPPPPLMPAGGEVTGGSKAAKKRGMQKLLKSAFKRGDHHAPAGASSGGGEQSGDDEAAAAAAQDLSRSSSSSTGGSSGRKGRKGDSSVEGDLSSRDSLELQESKNVKGAAAALRNAKLSHSYEAFPWERKMRDLLQVAGASGFLSLLLLPRATDETQTKFHSLEDTLARAESWLMSSQMSGVPIVPMNVQTEALLTKICGDVASSTVNMNSLGDLANMATVSLYGFEDYHGVDIGVVRAIRLWYAPFAGEMALEIKLQPGDTRLGFAISRTEEGFIYVSSVAEESTPGVASTRSGLLELYRRARRASKLLVVSRVGDDKVLPWATSTAGDIRCFDTVSLSQRLSLHRHALRPVTLHFLMWERLPPAAVIRGGAAARPTVQMIVQGDEEGGGDAADESTDEVAFDGDGPEIVLSGKDDSDDRSFRFQNIGLPDSWL
ncbi:uncharacterized protein [Oryza sativa Japonica Group]|uniref:Os08g0333100 protein n=5 Tax=Oryza TaxID=4527 RepID=Q6ZF93_ORYSJ|nr:uncharacterized protein LOC4345301 [Oryza sativa Japonica Group]KAB8108158.1 hypothetical protein EE612_043545 [Oryza sativa]BAD01690.1 unknown protein [Oryza sativa Japonica Group]BAD03908.1 unknown protein [Oryza sativa Japonica Group]BAF23486.1 Os08g0333100 [Oryza sativa Japonica Group]BAT04948.1 Os08g0333100 [Oryza sativa Japonica Group]|eukprot:NP_001061572.1 Os08g0333100 [Oryza sativa Japonica Group]